MENSNIAAIVEIEKQAMACRTRGERIGDVIARHAARLWFIAVHATAFTLWIAFSGKFDPFPFPFLTLVLSIESIFLSLFILMSQNRANKQADSRAHLDLQINLLAEQESTAALQMLHRLCEFHGLKIEQEVERLKETTEPESLLAEIKENLPEC